MRNIEKKLKIVLLDIIQNIEPDGQGKSCTYFGHLKLKKLMKN